MAEKDMITVVEPGFELLTPEEWFPGMLEIVEKAGRTCYKSEHKIHTGSAEEFVRRIIRSGHESVIEHCVITVKIICSRACSHQLVRHRIAAYSQESQRYCDYGKLGLQVICPSDIKLIKSGSWRRVYSDKKAEWTHYKDSTARILILPITNSDEDMLYRWLESIYKSYRTYLTLRYLGMKPEDARFVLPNATKTEVVTTFNLRQWRHVLKHRALNPRAQWEIRQIMLQILERFKTLMPVVFGDLGAKRH